MEYEVSFSEREMPPFQKLRSFKDKGFMSENHEVLDIQNSINVPTIIHESTEKVQDTLELSKPVPKLNVVQCVPNSASQFSSNLTELELSSQNFAEIPDFFKSFGNLKRLYIHDTSLSELPDSIGELKNLHDLNLSHNQLKMLPKTISDLKHLEKLNLSHNELQCLPSSYANLQLLRELDLSFNNFHRLPKCVQNGMGTLRLLNISENPHVRINVIPSSKYLEKLIAKNNKNCGNFPDWILCSKFFNMKEFVLDNTQFDVYTFNGKEGNLYYKKLSMASSNLSSSYLDMMVEHMINLQIVDVGNRDVLESGIGNFFNCIPIRNFRNPKLITELNFRGTGLATVSSTINELCNLKILDLGLNNISWFPDEFCELQKLEYLKIDGNDLILFPDDIGNLISIQEIHAQNNSLQSLPESFKNLKSLRLLDLYNNKFSELPEGIGRLVTLKGLDLELNYFTISDMKVGTNDYSALREYLKKYKCIDHRTVGAKQHESDDTESQKSNNIWFSENSSSEENGQLCVSYDSEENWDSISNTDDEYEPNTAEINYNERSKDYLKANFAPLGFCPADLHSETIQREVASMRIYGSLPSYKIVEGQFDDA